MAADRFLDLPNAELIRRTNIQISVYRDAIKEARDMRDFTEVRYLSGRLDDSKSDLQLLECRTW